MSISVNKEKCTGCGACVGACPFTAISMVDEKATIDLNLCTLCGSCVRACPVDAITIVKEKKTKKAVHDVSAYKGVCVFAEKHENEFHTVTFELLGIGRKLADDLGEELSAILIGHDIKDKAQELIHYGADKVYYYDNPQFKDFQDDSYCQVVSEAIDKYKPSILLAGATPMGRSFIPKVAARTWGGLTADCTSLEIDKEKHLLLGTRPAFGGNLMATIVCPEHRPQIATVRHKVMKPNAKDTSRTGEVLEHNVSDENLNIRTKLINVVKEIESTINIAEADIIVTGGRAVGGPDGFKIIRELAEAVGGAVGASRAAVDAGWIPYSHQVGQTGKTVNPKLYIACGISGAVQHMAGMQSSDYIIAINKDPDADIFGIADLGIVGDIFEIVPALTQKIKSGN